MTTTEYEAKNVASNPCWPLELNILIGTFLFYLKWMLLCVWIS